MASPYIAVRRAWTAEHLETVREELDRVRHRMGGALSDGSALALTFDLIFDAASVSKIKLDPMPGDELETIVAQFAEDNRPLKDVLASFARVVEAAHGIEEDDIPF